MDFVRPVEAVIPGAQGKLLSALAAVSEELSLRTLADLAGVSPAQASRVLARLVDLGLVTRREVPPSALFRLDRANLAARCVIGLADLRQQLLEELRVAARSIEPAPANLTLFGSLARGDMRADSDIDVLVVRPAGFDEDNDEWMETLGDWLDHACRLSGNPVEMLEVAEDEVSDLLRSRQRVWRDISREGRRVTGRELEEIAG